MQFNTTQIQNKNECHRFSGLLLLAVDLLHGNQLHQENTQRSHNKHCDLRLFKCMMCGKDFKLLQHDRIQTNSRA